MRETTRRQITLERTYDAPIQDVWDLWTTGEGLEAWWGPDGFEVKVTKLDLRPGGELLYDMTAVAPEVVAFLENAGMPRTTHAKNVFTEVVPQTRLAYVTKADFVPGVAPYDVATIVELEAGEAGVRMRLTFDAMHDEDWTVRAKMGHESELGKLDALLARRGFPRRS